MESASKPSRDSQMATKVGQIGGWLSWPATHLIRRLLFGTISLLNKYCSINETKSSSQGSHSGGEKLSDFFLDTGGKGIVSEE